MTQILPAAGVLLIADPFLKDPNFKRTVVFLCEHQDEGSFGFVLNRPYEYTLDQLMASAEGMPIPVFYGGPVQMDTVHFLHRYPDLIPGGFEVANGIYWGGDFETAVDLLKKGTIKSTGIRFFIGYSGWSEGQLQDELKEKSWITSKGTSKLIFHENMNAIWKDALLDLGGEYEQLINYPIDPQLN
ncbi:YqgE/AlgH family protein [Flavihumibacter profundi]|jgi:putative transcriptional regulator|uniref:YqgE/AlgH family protein n=1 Tax=Flavihumibacter profundi TaxID=2716883 RepID=UPI001CC6F1BD|nr:YqgE/AlgH family protein [Flavihumibacter profundi]MBZ5858224.1 YqgE/AlgH family protein [Flavihumibacter profundi]